MAQKVDTHKKDRFGFYDGDATSPSAKANIVRENLRLEKWRGMLHDFASFKRKNPSRISKRIRKGVPDAVRGLVWPLLCDHERFLRLSPGLFERGAQSENTAYDDYIQRDVTRTFPKHCMFAGRDGAGQSSLFRVLRSLAIQDTEVGYTQGMGFITALLLTYMPEQTAFYVMLSLLRGEKHNLRSMFGPGMILAQEHMFIFWELLNTFAPKLRKRMDGLMIHPSMFASHWFISVFSYSFPFELVTRVWDVFLAEGWKVVYRVALAMMLEFKDKMLAMDFEQILMFQKTIGDTLDVDKLMKKAFALSLTSKQIEKARQQFRLSLEEKASKPAAPRANKPSSTLVKVPNLSKAVSQM